MEIIYAICSWGLGHATRSLPVIRKLVEENNNVTIISNGRSLDLLKRELGKNASYVDIPDYPMLLSENARQFMAKSIVYWPVFIARMESGLQRLTKMLQTKKCDLIVSDGRYDMYSKKIPSFFISHQMRIMNPLRIHMFESGSEIFNMFFFKRFKGVIVPDFKENSLSGDLSHNLRRIDENKLNYVGVISDFKKKNVKKDVDFLISISGPEPQRSMLEKKLLYQASDLKGNVVITLGKTEEKTKIEHDNIKTYSFLNKNDRENLLNKSKMVVCRSGYSTIMDLAVIGTKALMIPTPGQIEQEYLAKFLSEKKTFHSVNQNSINLSRDVKFAQKNKGFTRTCDVNVTVSNILDVINN